jgi:hypothetical protein
MIMFIIRFSFRDGNQPLDTMSRRLSSSAKIKLLMASPAAFKIQTIRNVLAGVTFPTTPSWKLAPIAMKLERLIGIEREHVCSGARTLRVTLSGSQRRYSFENGLCRRRPYERDSPSREYRP